MKALSLLLCCLLSFAAHAGDAPSSHEANAKKEIEAVVEAFRTAIINRDQPAFERLFLHEHITWQSVTGDAALARIQQKAPAAQKLKIDANRTPYSFIAGIVASKNSSEETFDNAKIDTDGDLASVVFDYAFLSNGKETNHGKEAWHLLRTPDGWKIASVVWSVNLQPAPAN